MLQTAAAELSVRAVVCLASQGHGAGIIATLGERCPVLLIRGLDEAADEVGRRVHTFVTAHLAAAPAP